MFRLEISQRDCILTGTKKDVSSDSVIAFLPLDGGAEAAVMD